MPAEPLTLRPFSPLDRRPGAGTIVIVPGRGVPEGVYDWLAEGAVHAGWAAVVADGLYVEPLDDRGGPAAYAALTDALVAAGLATAPAGPAGPTGPDNEPLAPAGDAADDAADTVGHARPRAGASGGPTGGTDDATTDARNAAPPGNGVRPRAAAPARFPASGPGHGRAGEPGDGRGGEPGHGLAGVPGGAGPLVAIGHSTGARVALALAARLPLAGVAALCGIADLADHVSRAERFLPDYVAAVTSALGRPEDEPAAYAARSPVTWIDRVRCPLLLVAGAQDRVCPAYQTELLAEAARTHGLPVDSHVVPGAGHFFETRAATGTARPHVLAVITAWLATLIETPAPRTGPERIPAP